MLRVLRLLVLPLVLGLVAVAALVASGHIVLPPRYDPFAPFDLAEEPDSSPASSSPGRAPTGSLPRGTRPRRHRLRAGSGSRHGRGMWLQQCRTDRPPLGGVPRIACDPRLSNGPALAAYERHQLAPAASALLNGRLARIEHLGTYACRNIIHAATGRRSRHATAEAIDISGFVFGDGRRLTLTADWTSSDQARAGFLRAARDGACRWFGVTLSPDYNPLHYDHFHLDTGGGRACR